MVDLSNPLVKVRVASGTCTSVAVLTTLYRIFARARRGRLWLDDLWATISMCSLITQMVAVFVDPTPRNGVVRYYLMSNMFYAIIWPARLSLLFSIIRIDIEPRRQRILIFVVLLFILTWVVLTAQIYWECESNTTWKQKAVPHCRFSRAVGICQLISDIISDSILLLVPIRLFMLLRDKKLRYRLTVIFGTCIITTIVSFVHTAYMLEAKQIPILISAVTEVSVSLIVCNIPIMATTLLKLKDEDNLPTSPEGLPTLWTLMTMTTVNPPPTTSTVEECLHKTGSRTLVA